MRVLLDECVPRRLRSALTGHEVQTASEAGLAGLRNGELLRAAAASFDCFLTVDRNLQFQQNVSALPVAVLVVAAVDNRYPKLLAVVPQILDALGKIQPRELKVVGT
jgi:predicted nuclease of predicted toxin-antitoxin system